MNNLREQVGVYRRVDTTKLKLRTHPLIPIGTRFGRWEVLENNWYKDFNGQSHRACLVRCECAAKTEAYRTYGELRCGRSPSCGCISRERSIETVWKDLLAKIARRGWECHLTLPQLKVISQLLCVYCGKEPSNKHRLKYKVGGKYQRGIAPEMEIRYSGLDRIDSTKGYVLGNLVPCCFQCNQVKSKLPLDEFLGLIARIQAHSPTVAGIREQAATLFLEIGGRGK